MELTREGDYALRCVLEVARRGRVRCAEVAERQGVSPAFMGKVVNALARAGILSTRRGVKGGISLARRPEEITLLEVLEAIQGPLVLNCCLRSKEACSLRPNCPLYHVWARAQEDLERHLRVSFAEILNGGADGPKSAGEARRTGGREQRRGGRPCPGEAGRRDPGGRKS